LSVRDPGWWRPAGTGPVKNEGKDNAVAFADSQRNFELNAMCPFIINNFLHSARILGET
jgi:fumarate hydratase class II